MIEEAPSADLDGFRPGDPYDLDLPERWSAQYRDRTAVYENDRGDHRVRIVEFSKGLSLYWWVDVYVGDEEWRRQEVGLGESYTDPDDAVAAVESYLEIVAEADPDSGSHSGLDDATAPDSDVLARTHLPGPEGWTLADAIPDGAGESVREGRDGPDRTDSER
ncbi:hypothetical protein [Halobellus sp. EA9]|uniref:hypothetical protein n=1 Tax=Halobellus sp. EA9 TaxID=3421647 RepID=UPI003EBE0D18